MPHPSRPLQRVLEIDALRFIAALMVVVFHWAFRGGATHDYTESVYQPLMPAAQYGYLGVELFFMISGFVILMSAQGRSVREFAVSRIVRLYPAFWACCTITALSILLFADPHFRIDLTKYLLNMTMLSDFLPIDVPLIDGVYWSLFVEIRFYCFVGLVVALGWLVHTERLLWAWLAVSALLQWVAPNSRVSEWLIAPYAPLFIAGACCYLIHSRGLSARRLLLLAATFPAALHHVFVGAAWATHRFPPYELKPVWAGVVLAVFYLTMLLVATRGIGWLRGKALVGAGALTYPLYLLHENIGFMVFNRFGAQVNQSLLFWGSMAAMIVLSWAVYRFVERPLSPLLKSALQRVLRPRRAAQAAAS